VNCYLIETNSNFFLIDTGSSKQRKELDLKLNDECWISEKLKLIVITHGDFDHTGNAVYLRQTYEAKKAMHRDDAEMAEKVDMFSTRKQSNFLVQMIAPMLLGYGRNERFKPDILIHGEYDLSPHNLDAKVITIPGHSKGSIGILMGNGDFYCGDLLENHGIPKLNSIMDDPVTAKESVEILKSYEIKTIYPGHGEPFTLKQLKEDFGNR